MKKVHTFVVPVTITMEDLTEAFYDISHEELLGVVKHIDLDVCQDLGYTEMVAKWHVGEMFKASVVDGFDEESTWENFVNFVNTYEQNFKEKEYETN